MYLLYSLALSLLFLARLPWFFYQAIRHGKYASSFKERMGRLNYPCDDARPTIWVHAVSVGEFNAARPLLAHMRKRWPDWQLVISTTTMTGQQLARARAGEDFDQAVYFPLDWAFAVRRALDCIRPTAVIILETELWPNFLRECRRRGIKTILVNGRISPRSFSRYLKVRPLFSRVLGDLSVIAMQSEADAERVLRLGASKEKVRVCGNLKYDVTTSEKSIESTGEDIDLQFALSSSERLIVAGSTAAGEETILLDALLEARNHQGLGKTRLLIAPRHPERFEEVAGLISQSGLSFGRRSEKNNNRSADVILLDSIGELAAAYRVASVVFVGGSLVPRGGHNIIEPAAFAKPIITGPHTENFRQIVSDFKAADAIAQVEPDQLARALIQLLTDDKEAQAMGERARSILEKNRGATLSVVAAIEEALEGD